MVQPMSSPAEAAFPSEPIGRRPTSAGSARQTCRRSCQRWPGVSPASCLGTGVMTTAHGVAPRRGLVDATRRMVQQSAGPPGRYSLSKIVLTIADSLQIALASHWEFFRTLISSTLVRTASVGCILQGAKQMPTLFRCTITFQPASIESRASCFTLARRLRRLHGGRTFGSRWGFPRAKHGPVVRADMWSLSGQTTASLSGCEDVFLR
mmetsp:Transcript_127747/g.397874  ORF Transcript_127747/g.397874 Transcript_127747/m.397874 type:complete len:208 (-) Transcript_127747:204-827(-)